MTVGWPYGVLDAAGLRAGGWRPTALREFVLKVHQHCNLACDYCYVYTLADQSWRTKPATMSEPVLASALHRIAEHAARHSLTETSVVLHGGEPLLVGADRLAAIAAAVRAAMPPGVSARISTQTNGVLLTGAALAVLARAGIRIGVSVDGAAADHDRHRAHVDGRGSFAEIRRALGLLADPAHAEVYGGLLCVVDPDTDPVACYESLLRFDPPALDFLLPHANWSAPPARRPGAYGDWLAAVFDRWYAPAGQETRVRLFEDIIQLLLGGHSGSEQVGLSPSAMIVVETDGAIEQVDALKSAYPGAAATGLNVLTDPFDAALDHPGLLARQIGAAALGPTCQACPVRSICGGGHYAHRYRAGGGFRNPSVYCADMSRIIGHIRDRVRADLARRAGRGAA